LQHLFFTKSKYFDKGVEVRSNREDWHF